MRTTCCKNSKITLIVLFLFICISSSYAQNEFELNGAATSIGGSCYRLTSEEFSQVGSIWYLDKIDLNQPFDVIMTVMLGCKDADGADGIVFGFQPISTSVGTVGGGLGFAGISPSIGIEMDTWQNTSANDPVFDHIAIIRNGDITHTNNLAGPVPCKPNQANVEDCQSHDFRVSWNPATLTLIVYFDCEERLRLENYDIVNEIFGGDPLVYWGFTASTGGSNNRQQICFEYTSFLNTMPDQFLCIDSSVVFQAPPAVAYLWTPATGLSDPTSATPTASPSETTLYTILMTDDCGREYYDTVTVFVGGYPVGISLPTDTSLCIGESLYLNVESPEATSYLWSNGLTTPDITISSSGTYIATVTSIFCPTKVQTTVGYDAVLDINLGPDTVICTSIPLILTLNLPSNTQYYWQNGSNSPTLSVSETGIYGLQASNACGTDFDEIFVGVEDCQRVFIPNIFTPNNDGVNDFFGVGVSSNIVKVNNFLIFDRWGTLILRLENYLPAVHSFEWDGSFRGKILAPDVFVYIAEIAFRDGTTTLLKGDVTLTK